MCKMKLLLKTRRSRGCHQENIKPTSISQFVKVYLSTHDITNNLSGQDIEFTLG